MAFAVVVHTHTASTSGAIDTTGADLVVGVYTINSPSALTVTYSVGGGGNVSMTGLTLKDSGVQAAAQLFYKEAPAVGSTTYTIGGSGNFPMFAVAAFSGSLGSGAFDQQSGHSWTTAVSSDQPGSITGPASALYVTGLGSYVDSLTPDATFTIIENVAKSGSVNYATGLSWVSSSSAQNPTWTFVDAGFPGGADVMATFKAAAVGDVLFGQMMM